MSIEDKMNIDERRKYLYRMKKRRVKADRKKRGQLLDEMEAVTELHRKTRVSTEPLFSGDTNLAHPGQWAGCYILGQTTNTQYLRKVGAAAASPGRERPG